MSARIADRPQPGHFKLRLCKGGPFVAASISFAPSTDPETGEPLDRSWHWEATIAGSLVADPSPSWVRAGVDRVWLFGTPIDKAEHDFLLSAAAWDRAHAPDAPMANPQKPVDIRAIEPIF